MLPCGIVFRRRPAMDNFSASLRLSKPAVHSELGVVAAQHRRAAEVGAAVLGRGRRCGGRRHRHFLRARRARALDERARRGRCDGPVPRRRAALRRDRLRHAGAGVARSRRLPVDRRGHLVRSVPLVARAGRSQRAWTVRDRRARRGGRHAGRPRALRDAALAGAGRAGDRLGGCRPADRLVRGREHRQRCRRSDSLSRQPRSLSRERPAAGPGVVGAHRSAARAEAPGADPAPAGRGGAARLLRRRARGRHRGATCKRRAGSCRARIWRAIVPAKSIP